MKNIKDPLLVEITQQDKAPIRLAEDFYFRCDGKKCIYVRKGFLTDGASVPRPFSAFVHRLGRHGKAAILHDWLYTWPEWVETYDEYIDGARDARHAADLVFWEAMQTLKVPKHRAFIIYYAVRLFGWIAWRRSRAYQSKYTGFGEKI